MMQWFHFELGICNAYIPIFLLVSMPRVLAMALQTNLQRAHTFPPMNVYEKILYIFWLGIFAVYFVISFFIPLQRSFLFLLGVFLCALSFIALALSKYTYETAPKEKLVKTGLYKISRNPGYFSTFVYLLGTSFMARSWFFLFYQIVVRYEERMCENLYGKEYIAYKNKTAKNFLFF